MLYWRPTSCNCLNVDCLVKCGWEKSNLYPEPNNVRDEPVQQSVDHDNRINDWVIINYQQNWFVGQVMDIDKNDNELQVTFLKSRGRGSNLTFTWPQTPDVLWVRPQDIMFRITEPTSMRRGFKLDQQSMVLVEEAAMRLGQTI